MICDKILDEPVISANSQGSVEKSYTGRLVCNAS